jgi:SHS2 domain-containing protein
MYELVHHTADVRLRVAASSVEELFRDAVRGMYAVMRGEREENAHDVVRTIEVEDSPDTTALLVDFLNEVLNRAQIGRELFSDVVFMRFDGTSLTAELSGIAPASFEEDVKAVTYHEADVRQDGGGWTTMLVFDL